MTKPQFIADLVTFTEEVLNEKLHVLCSGLNPLIEESEKNIMSAYLIHN